MQRYMFLIFGDESERPEPTPEEWERMMQAHRAWAGEVEAAGATIVAGEALAPAGTATSVRQGDAGALVTDGPFAETKEALGGFYTVDCPDLDVALALAKTLPAGGVEVRPVVPTS